MKKEILTNSEGIIDHGWQYTVYHLNAHRVFKVKKGIIESYMTFMSPRNHKTVANSIESILDKIIRKPWVVFKILKNIYIQTPTSINGIRSRIENGLDQSLFGNPTFYPGLHYEQDRVHMLGQFVSDLSEADQRDLVDRYTEKTLFLWENKTFESSFAIARNYGMLHGELVMVDLGDFVFTYREAERILASGHPLEAWDYKNVLPAPFQKAYKNTFEKYLTVDMLRQSWNIKTLNQRLA